MKIRKVRRCPKGKERKKDTIKKKGSQANHSSSSVALLVPRMRTSRSFIQKIG